ncbi:MAG: OsmC family protein [Candidatus Obscuribacterales bacterium]|nr:OsmC family protein [Candidatus Obscuribacterales bacterium]
MTEVLVSSTAAKGMQHDISAGSHKLIADAGKDIGGNESGPNPHELLLASLGACTSMTLKVFAQRRGWQLDEVRVKLQEEMIEDPAVPGKKIARITRDIEVKGELSQEQKDTLKSIADKCPIHKILVDSKQIVTNLAALN